MQFRQLILMAGFFLTACSVMEPYKPPEMVMPKEWVATSKNDKQFNSLSSPSICWWRSLNDKPLEQLIQQALQQNYDLQIAASKIHQARAERKIANATLLPEITASVSPQRGNKGMQTNNVVTDILDAKFDASWELDLFGALQDQVDAHEAGLAAAEFAREAAEISLVAEIARTYIELRHIQTQHTLTLNIHQALKGLNDLAQVLSDAGLLSEMEVAQAEALLTNQSATLAQYGLQTIANIRRLEGLCSVHPGAFDALLNPLQPLPTLSVEIVLQTPASTIASRPDLRQAERQLAAATALEAEANKLIFPKINLASMFGLQDTSKAKRTNTWLLGGTLSIPFLNFGTIEGQIEKAEGHRHEVFLVYQKQVLQALHEIEMSLESFLRESDRLEHLHQSAAKSEQAARYALERFKKGIAAFQTVLNYHKNLLESQSLVASSKTAQLINWISLQKALGTSVR